MEVSARDVVLQIWHLSYKTKPGCPYPLEQQDVFLLLSGQECQISPYTIRMDVYEPSERFSHNRDNNPISLQVFTLLDKRWSQQLRKDSSRSAWAAYLLIQIQGLLIQISRFRPPSLIYRNTAYPPLETM